MHQMDTARGRKRQTYNNRNLKCQTINSKATEVIKNLTTSDTLIGQFSAV